jgi:hypothetical protein
VQLTFDAEVEAFRAEFIRFLEDHLPTEAQVVERSRSTSDLAGRADTRGRRRRSLRGERAEGVDLRRPRCRRHPPVGGVNRDRYATIVMDYQALRALGSVALGQAARGKRGIPSVSVLKVLGSEAVRARPVQRELVRALHQHLRGDDRRRHVRDSAQHHRAASVGTSVRI